MVNADMSLIRKMIALEKNVGLLYTYFQDKFPEDKEFWKKLAAEEIKHATLIETHADFILDSKEAFSNLFESSEESLERIYSKVTQIIENLDQYTKSREDAFLVALQLEQSAGELHYQNIVKETENGDEAPLPLTVFNLLANYDKDHSERILKYLEKIHNLNNIQ